MEACKLTEVLDNKKFKILEFKLDNDVKQRLHTMGIHFNDIYIRQNASSWGPILIQNLSNNASRIAIGRNLAEKILVECE